MNAAGMVYMKNRFTAGIFGRFGDFIVGIVREQSVSTIFPTCCESTIARYKHPMVGIAHHIHKKGTNRIEICDFKPRFIFDGSDFYRQCNIR